MTRWIVCGLAVLALLVAAAAAVPWLLVVAAAAMVIGLLLVLWRIAGPRPEQVALALAALVVAGGAADAVVRVADGVADSRVELHGRVDPQQLLATFSPGATAESLDRRGFGHMVAGEATDTVPEASGTALALWGAGEVAPWALAAVVLVLMAPILRASRRGDPFSPAATRRLVAIGALLFFGIPLMVVLRFVASEVASFGTFASPLPEPHLTLSLAHLLPGVLVLALAAMFQRGDHLRDFERHTV